MSKPKVKFDHGAVGAFLRGPEVQRMVGASGARIAAAAGDGFTHDVWISPDPGRGGGPRAISGVTTDSWGSRKRQSQDNLLIRARDAGRV